MGNPTFYQGPGDYISVSISLDANQSRVLTASLLPVNGLYPNLPAAVFAYENTGTNQLGTYIGVVNIGELTRLQVFNPSSPIPVFGNKYVRHEEAKITLGLNDDYLVVVSAIKDSIAALSAAMKLKNNISEIVYVPAP